MRKRMVSSRQIFKVASWLVTQSSSLILRTKYIQSTGSRTDRQLFVAAPRAQGGCLEWPVRRLAQSLGRNRLSTVTNWMKTLALNLKRRQRALCAGGHDLGGGNKGGMDVWSTYSNQFEFSLRFRATNHLYPTCRFILRSFEAVQSQVFSSRLQVKFGEEHCRSPGVVCSSRYHD